MTQQASPYIIETFGLTKRYNGSTEGTIALAGIDLYVQRGEFLGVMGPSGSGKTTLLNTLSTIDKPSSGQILFDRKRLDNMNEKDLAQFRRANVGFVFQEYNLLDNLSVRDNIALPLVLQGRHTREILFETDKLAKFFGIEDQLPKAPYQLSGGQRQRVAAARAMISGPKVLFADEPTGSLDSRAATELLGQFQSLNESYGATILMVTHDAFAASYCDRVLFLKDGAIYGRLDKSGQRQVFFQSILDMLGAMGGAKQ
jgi:putative ABC transport system ATP-binding protein